MSLSHVVPPAFPRLKNVPRRQRAKKRVSDAGTFLCAQPVASGLEPREHPIMDGGDGVPSAFAGALVLSVSVRAGDRNAGAKRDGSWCARVPVPQRGFEQEDKVGRDIRPFQGGPDLNRQGPKRPVSRCSPAGIPPGDLVRDGGFEPPASTVRGWRSSGLS